MYFIMLQTLKLNSINREKEKEKEKEKMFLSTVLLHALDQTVLRVMNGTG